MSTLRSDTLGIVACPGAEVFAAEVITHLRGIYRRKYNRIAEVISKKYDLTLDEAIRRINLEIDLHASRIRHGAPPEKIVPPKFQTPVDFTRFANGEFKTKIRSSIRGMEIYIVQDVENHYPIECNDTDDTYELSVNDHCMILFTTIDALFQAGAGAITLVLPTYPFARQHGKKGREALTASMFGRIVEHLGVKRVITLDIHSKEIENSFQKARLENLHGSYQILKKLKDLIDLQNTDMVVVSPDTGAVDRNKFYSGNLGMPLALLYKERDYSKVTKSAKDNNITALRLLGSVQDKAVFMADDLLGTGGTLIKAMRFLKEQGAKEIVCAASLPLFTGEAIENFDSAYEEGLFHRVIGTNGVHHDEELLKREWYVRANISNLFARIIFRLHHNRSLSELLDNRQIIQRLLAR
jgi:ribose-phosphate pyrophosphokinase